MNEDVMKWIGGLLAGIGWFILVMTGKADSSAASGFIEFAKFILVGLGAHGLTMSHPRPTMGPTVPATAPPTAPTGQSGRIDPWLLVVVVVGVLVWLTACAAIPEPVVAAKKASDDNAVENWKVLICDLPVGAVLRHAEIASTVRAFCLPPAGAGDSLLPTKP